MNRAEYDALIEIAKTNRGPSAADLARQVIEGKIEPSVAGSVLLARALRKVTPPPKPDPFA